MSERPHPDDDAHRGWSEGDQTTADSDQTAADLDQSLAESDQMSSERDQHAADRDQQSAERDQAASARAQATDHAIDPAALARSDDARALSASERASSSRARAETISLRDQNAARRDRVAADRDAAAYARDRLAASIDAEMDLLDREHAAGHAGPEANGSDRLARLAEDRRRAAAGRDRAAQARDAAARDRQKAAEDRELASRDRHAAAEALWREGNDQLTGALGRRAGLRAIRREMDRTARSGEPLVLVFVDVDGLKAINDTLGHPAGDAVLRTTARCIARGLRSYDVIMRYGGDEFVCSLTGHDLDGANERFAQISAHIARDANGQTITVGLAQREPQEALDAAIARADAAMLAARATRRG
ncbi:MAG TPA: GGDEF domain-containing protein [Baekduia sp.]|nr:GGDEF domain-containing protein [Baekduia sp.]